MPYKEAKQGWQAHLCQQVPFKERGNTPMYGPLLCRWVPRHPPLRSYLGSQLLRPPGLEGGLGGGFLCAQPPRDLGRQLAVRLAEARLHLVRGGAEGVEFELVLHVPARGRFGRGL